MEQYGIDLETAEVIQKMGGIKAYSEHCYTKGIIDQVLKSVSSGLNKVSQNLQKISEKMSS